MHGVDPYVYVLRCVVATVVCVRLNGKQSLSCWRLHKGAFEWLGSGKFIADVRERISTQVEWPFTAKATGAQSRGGRRTADRSQDTHTLGALQSARRQLCTAPNKSISLSSFKFKIIIPFILTLTLLCCSLAGFPFSTEARCLPQGWSGSIWWKTITYRLRSGGITLLEKQHTVPHP